MDETFTIEFNGRLLKLHLRRSARQALQQRQIPLYVEMELYFSCMIRKKVRFYDQARDVAYHPIQDKLYLGFRPVMTQQCSIHDTDGPPPVTDFPITRTASFTPHWLSMDFHNGQWCGEFGYD